MPACFRVLQIHPSRRLWPRHRVVRCWRVLLAVWLLRNDKRILRNGLPDWVWHLYPAASLWTRARLLSRWQVLLENRFLWHDQRFLWRWLSARVWYMHNWADYIARRQLWRQQRRKLHLHGIGVWPMLLKVGLVRFVGRVLRDRMPARLWRMQLNTFQGDNTPVGHAHCVNGLVCVRLLTTHTNDVGRARRFSYISYLIPCYF